MTKFRKYMLAGAAFAAPLASFAEGESASALETACQDLEDGVTSLVSTVAPHVAAVVVALLAIVGIFFAWKYIRKAIGR